MAITRSDIGLNQTSPSAQPGVRSPWLTILLAVALAVITILVFLPVRGFDYVNYDDGDYVMGNREVQGGLTAHSIAWAFTTGHAANWHPITWLSHMLDFQLFGNKPGLHHLTSLLFHAANAVLLFFVMRRLTGTQWRSAFVAAIFALHPVHVESVAWLSERKDVLSGFFWMLTMLFYARYAEGKKTEKTNYIVNYVVCLICFALGLMSKPMLVTLPCVLLLLDFWPLNRFEMTEGRLPKLRDRTNALLLLEKVPFLMLAIASSAVTFLVQQKGGAVASMASLSFADRLFNALVSYLRYTQKILWPNDLAVLYPHPGSWPVWRVSVAIFFIIAALAIAFWQMRKQPFLLVGTLWFFGTLVPVIGIVQVGIQSMADRYTYIPSIGFSIAVTWAVVYFASRFSIGNKVLSVVGVALVAACVAVTSVQIGYWRNSETLFKRTISVTDKNYLAWNNLGFSLSKTRSSEAMQCYRESIKINPAYADALNNLGHALAEQGKVLEALPLYEAALKQQPKNADVNNNYGNALAESGKVDEGIKYYLIALAANPNHADAHNNYGIALAMHGKLDEAVLELQKAVELDPDKASAHSNLGNAFAVQHKLDRATAHYLQAIRLKPDEAQVHNNLGNVLSEQTKYSEAIEQYELALKLNTKNPEAHYNLGLALLHVAKSDEAIAHFRQAVQLRPNYPEAQRQLTALGATK
ncbi:MAG: Tetratricopeptide 2 repeat protein [Verrucomicrobiales bacterium]|nr:Tetratricopeptide 2 repeat protein [Verrucomicrobiales bacterium]